MRIADSTNPHEGHHAVISALDDAIGRIVQQAVVVVRIVDVVVTVIVVAWIAFGRTPQSTFLVGMLIAFAGMATVQWARRRRFFQAFARGGPPRRRAQQPRGKLTRASVEGR